jgi:hypothetical protein
LANPKKQFPISDNYLKKDNRDQNKGSSTLLKTDETNKSHIPIRFDQNAITGALNSKPLISATLKVYIVQNWGGFTTSGKRVEVYRMTADLGDWLEMESAWNCPYLNCPTHWDGGTTVSTVSDHKQWYDTTVGWQSFDITTDVNSFLSGTATNYGWLLTKQYNFETGSVDIASREYGDTSKIPKLQLTIDDTYPSITSTITPTPNTNGWNSASDVTVHFSCSDPEGISSCTADQHVTADTAGQDVIGQACDSYGLCSSTTVIVKNDRTAPTIQIFAPANGATLVGSTINVTGSVSDSLSGSQAVTCNGSSATIDAGTFTASVTAVLGSNTISCQAIDLAGNSGTSSIAITRVSQQTFTFNAIADTYLDGNSYLNANYGNQPSLRLGQSPDINHVLVKFNQDDIIAALGTNHVDSAYLQFYEETNFGYWGSGTNVDVFRLSHDWDEMNVTFACPNDADTTNDFPDCDDVWTGGFHEDSFSDTLQYLENETGWKTYNVTSDLQLIQNGFDHYGWLLKKRDYANGGILDFTSIQGTAAQWPKLIVTVDDQSCPATSIDSISPGLIPSDGTMTTITVSGTNLDRITTLYLDGTPIAFTLVDTSTIMFSQSYVSDGDHNLSFISNCVNEPIPTSFVRADTPENIAAQSPGSCDIATPASTLFQLSNGTDKVLCWNRRPTILIGYSADFRLVNQDKRGTNALWDSTNKSSIIESYLKKTQWNLLTADNSSRGTNFIRLVATGTSCSTETGTGTPMPCKGYAGDPETMPFANRNGKYNVRMLNSATPPAPKADGSQLNATWKARFASFLRYADQTGTALMVDLFDENNLKNGNSTQPQDWDHNPWNPSHNNLHDPDLGNCTKLDNLNGNFADALPAFYKIFNADGSFNCLGKIQRKYVQSVVNFSRNAKACGNATDPNQWVPCRNTIFEVMNEARYNASWNTGTQPFSAVDFQRWHNAVAGWVRNAGGALGGPLVAASVKSNAGADDCSTGDLDNSCLFADCTATSCSGTNNYFKVFTASNINIVSLHAASWLEGITRAGGGQVCVTGTGSRAAEARVFRKPVIFDDDGDDSDLSNNGKGDSDSQGRGLQKWAKQVSSTCGYPIGALHLYHTKDGTVTEGTISDCRHDDDNKVDCFALNALGDGLKDSAAEKFCGTSAITNCQAPLDYCENYVDPDPTPTITNACTPVQDAESNDIN